MKKTTQLLMIMVPAMALVACGKYEKQPVKDIAEIREQAKAQAGNGLDSPQEITREVTRTPRVIIEPNDSKPETIDQTVVRKIDASVVKIVAIDDLNFVEGQKKVLKIRAQINVPEVTTQLEILSLPAGAETLQAVAGEANVYALTYTAPLNSAPATINLKLKLKVTGAPTEEIRRSVEALPLDKQIALRVTKTNEELSSLVLEKLTDEVSQETMTPFQVTVKVPGTDDKSAPPTLEVSRDADGHKFVVADPEHTKTEFIGEAKWRFSLIFDTKNIAVPQTPTSIAAGGLSVRLSLKAKHGKNSSPTLVKVLKIRYTKLPTTPQFDIKALNGPALILERGSKKTLDFAVGAMNPQVEVKVELPNLQTLVGKPTIECKVSAKALNSQTCKLVWNVPCEATDKELQNEIKLTAQSIVDGQATTPISHTLKTTAAKTKNAKCQKPTVAGAKKVQEKK